MMDKGEPKSGLKTTEFYLALLAQVIPVLVILGVMTGEQATTLVESAGRFAAAAAAVVASVWPIVQYIKGRAEVKAAAVSETTVVKK